MKNFLYIVLLLISPSLSIGQHVKVIEIANEFYRLEEYANAIRYYKAGLKKSNRNYIILQLGNCYRHLNDNTKAEFYYKQIIEEIPDSNNYRYAQLLKKNEKYKEAKDQFVKLVEFFPEKQKYLTSASSCDSALKWMKEKPLYTVQNINKINTEYSEITPVLYKDGVIFASNREQTIIRKKAGVTGQPYYDLFLSYTKEKNGFGTPKHFSAILNSIHHETAPSFTRDFKKIFFTRVKDYQGNKNKIDNVNRPKLYCSEEKNGQWGKPEKFIFNDTTYSFAHPSVDSSEKMFFFASDLPGGFGGSDIYVCFKIDSNWSNPVNLGPVINTKGNEIYPFYHSSGTLYFSSDEHPGMGGYDIFAATQENGDWIKVLNVKFPINSSCDDFSIFFNEENNKGYFSSNRHGGKGAEDIYLIELMGETSFIRNE